MHNHLELYESVAGWEEATIDIMAIIKIARFEVQKGLKDPKEAYKEVNAVLNKYEPWGANDSEPRWNAAKMFTRGTDLDPDDFYI